tara:strand:+ start:714 stop:854 length:141 start_codon:yes stop_codon:yes gene_type:complete
MEVTFIRNDYLERFKNKSKLVLPHNLDRKNVEKFDDIEMPSIWWEK